MLPVKTIKQGETTIKIVVDDFYKTLNRVIDGLNNLVDSSNNIIDSVHKEYEDYEGELIIGRGVSQPCNGDKYDEALGSEIAFRKAKINGNLKKCKIIERLLTKLWKYEVVLSEELTNLDTQLLEDSNYMKQVNPNFYLG